MGPAALWPWGLGELVRNAVLDSAPDLLNQNLNCNKSPGGWCSYDSVLTATLKKGLLGHKRICRPRECYRNWKESVGSDGADQLQSKQVGAEVWKEDYLPIT